MSINPISRAYSNGLTLTTLFSGWPRERLGQVYVPFLMPARPEAHVCTNFWALRPWSVRRLQGHDLAKPSGPPTATRRALLQLARRPWVMRAAVPLREGVYVTAGVRAARRTPDLDTLAPQLVFSNLGSLSAMRIALEYCRMLNVRLVPLITDDWIATEYRDAFFGRRLRRQLESAFGEVLALSPVRLVISPRMGEEYQRRYGGVFVPFTQLVDPGVFGAAPRPATTEGPLTLVYAGQLGLGRAEMLTRVGRALGTLRREGITGRLVVYTNAAHAELYRRQFADAEWIEFAGTVPHTELPAIYANADVLVHAESFDPATVAYTRYSLSTKISEYLMSGRPILAYGPADCGSIDYVARSGGGVTVTTESEGELVDTLRGLLGSGADRVRLGSVARAFAHQHHDARTQRERFRELLRSVATRDGSM